MENSETTIAAEPAEQSTAPESAASAPAAVPAALVEPASTEAPLQPRPKGRPQGSKDRQARTRRPNVRVEPIPPREAPVPTAATAPPPAPAPTPAREPVEEEEPPSPQTLYRETSKRLVHLRGLLNENRRSAAADKYTSKLSLWTM
jgi:hypothetical protein